MRKPKPMVQGDLDSLCGLYSAVNAIRWILGGNPPGLTAEDVFAIVVMQVDRVGGAGAALTGGIDPRALHRALGYTLEVLREDYGCDIVADLPFADRRKIGFVGVRAELAAELVEPGIAHVIVFRGHLNHWSVVTAVTDANFVLFDSAGHRRVPLDHCRIRGDAAGRKNSLHVLERKGIIRLRHRPTGDGGDRGRGSSR